MNHVFYRQTGLHETQEELYGRLQAVLKENGIEYKKEMVQKAYEFTCQAHQGQKRYSGDDYVTHPINVAILVAEMEGDEDTVVGALLSEILVKTRISPKELEAEFSTHIVDILRTVRAFPADQIPLTEWEAVLITLASCLHNMRTLEAMNQEKWEEKARETIEMYLPVAREIKNEKLVAELNDLSLKYLAKN